MDIAALISSFATGTYTVTRRTRPTLSYGKAVAGTTSITTITASVSPASGKDLLKLAEGRSTDEAFVVFTTTQLRTGGKIGESEGEFLADVITIDSKDFQVEHVETWRDSATGNVGYRCVVRNV